MTSHPHTEETARSVGLARWSRLSRLLDSPLACRYALDTPDEDTDARGFGRLAHIATLQPERFETDVLIEPDFGDLRTKAGKAERRAWYAEIAPGVEVNKTEDVARALACLRDGIEVASAEERARALACAEAVRKHPDARALLEAAQTEVELTWERLGIRCGGRLDILQSDGVTDLKTTRRSSLKELRSDLARYAYHGQLAFYHDGAIRAGKIGRWSHKRPHMIAVQTEPPHDVAVLQMSPETLKAGEALCDRLLSQWVGCHEANWWPGMAPGVVEWGLPTWAPGMIELAESQEQSEGEDW